MQTLTQQEDCYHVFLSHNQADKDLVGKLAEEWRLLGLKVFYDAKSIEPGHVIRSKVEEGIDTSERVIVFITQDSVKSRWVAFETIIAWASKDENRSSVIPVLLESVPSDEWPLPLPELRAIDLANPAKSRGEYKKLMEQLGITNCQWPSCLEPWNRGSLKIIGRNREQRAFNAMLGGDRRLMNISGIGGIGKSTLVQGFRNACVGFPTALVNSSRIDASANRDRYPVEVEAMSLIVDDLKKSGCELAHVADLLERYKETHATVTSDAGSPRDFVGMVLRAEVRMPDTYPLPPFQDDTWTRWTQVLEQVQQAIDKLRHEEDKQLVSGPVSKLSKALVADLNSKVDRPIVLFFDELELFSDNIEDWLSELFLDTYGPLDKNVKLLIASQRPLGKLLGLPADARFRYEHLQLQPFTSDEVREYLDTHLSTDLRDRIDFDQIIAEMGKPGKHPLLLRLVVEEAENIVSDSVPYPANLSALIERILRSTDAIPTQRKALEMVCVARTFDLDVLMSLLGGNIPQTEAEETFNWLESLQFVNRQASGLAVHDLVRATFLDLQNPHHRRHEHELLLDYYNKLGQSLQGRKEGLTAAVESAYHALSVAGPEDVLQIAMNSFLRVLPDVSNIVSHWCSMLRQIADEGRADLPQATQFDLRQLADALNSWSSIPTDYRHRDAKSIEPAVMSVFFTNMFRSDLPNVNQHNAYHWFEYLEARVGLAREEGSGKLKSTDKLERIWTNTSAFEDSGTALLRFCLASDIGESYTKFGRIADAVRWNELAFKLAEEHGRPLQKALALYQLGTNHKRLGDYGRALKYEDEALKIFNEHEPGNRYHRGRLYFDKGVTLTYLNEWELAEKAYDNAQSCLMHSSPQSQAELLHRRGWLLRMCGRLDNSLDKHQGAVKRFDKFIKSTDTTVESALLPSLRAKAIHSMANTLTEMNCFEEALDRYDEALEVFTKEGSLRHCAITYKDRAWSCYKKHGRDAAHKDLANAIEQLSRTDLGNDKDVAHLAEAFLARAMINVWENSLSTALGDLDKSAAAISAVPRGDFGMSLVSIRVVRALALTLVGRREQADRLLDCVQSYEKLSDKVLAQIEVIRGAQVLRDGGDASPRFDKALAIAGQWNEYFKVYVSELIDVVRGVCSQVNVSLAASPNYVDYFDASENYLGTTSSEVAHDLGLWHRSFHCWIGHRTDQDQCHVLFQQRGHTKKDYPNLLDMSVAGHYHTGEGLDGGLREIDEELGLPVEPEQLHKQAVRVINEQLKNGRLNREFQDIYTITMSVDLMKLQPRFPEVRGFYLIPLLATAELLDRRREDLEVEGIAADLESGSWAKHTTKISLNDFVPEAHIYLKVVLQMMREVLGCPGDCHQDRPPYQEGVLEDKSIWRPHENHDK